MTKKCQLENISTLINTLSLAASRFKYKTKKSRKWRIFCINFGNKNKAYLHTNFSENNNNNWNQDILRCLIS